MAALKDARDGVIAAALKVASDQRENGFLSAVASMELDDALTAYTAARADATSGPNPFATGPDPDAELEQLREDAQILAALRAAGVDNWDGYSIALAALRDDDDT